MKWTMVTENAKYQFEVGKAGNRDWYVRAVRKFDSKQDSLAGFSTKRVAVECAHVWAGWMK